MVALALFLAAARLPAQDPARWEDAIRAFEEADRLNPPPPHAVLFVGSSSIRLWDLERWFPERRTIRRGFGGSHLGDVVHYARRIILPYRPEVIVVYAGDNDIAAGKTPERVAADFERLRDIVRAELPGTALIYIAIKPSLKRWALVSAMREANRRIRAVCDRIPGFRFLDIDAPMIGADGKPRSELFVADGLHLNDEGYRLWSSLLEPVIEELTGGRFRVAVCQFPVSSDVQANARAILEQMRAAYRNGADVAHFPECALSGYAGVDHESLEGFDWDLQRRLLKEVLSLAKELKLWVVLGAAHPLTPPHKPHDSLYVISPRGEVLDRYDKRFCTGGDLRHYTAGDHFVIFSLRGVRCGLAICYDVRFPELFRRYKALGAEVLFVSFYNARQKPGSVHPEIMPATLRARAATNYFWISATNSSAPESWPGLLVRPDGRIAARLEKNQGGVQVELVDTRKKYYDASGPYRLRAMTGRLSSGDPVADPRSADRRGY